MKKFFWMILLVMIFAACDSTPAEIYEYVPVREAGAMEVYVFGIDGADAILITTENYTVMIDTGDRQHAEHIVRRLAQKNITDIDYLILTHFNREHIGGAYRVIENFDIGEIILPNYLRESGHIRRMNEASTEIETRVLTETISLHLDDAEFTINPSGLPFFSFIGDDDDGGDDEEAVDTPNEKNFSILVGVEHGENSFLFTGGSVSVRLEELVTLPEFARHFDFVKMPNHGRSNRMTGYFVSATTPRYAVTTDCDRRPTDDETISALGNAQVFSAKQGGILAHSDGESLTVTHLYGVSCSWFLSPHTPAGILEVYTFGLYDADAILITTSSHKMMIDTGRRSDADLIVQRLHEKGVTHIDYMVITHFHGDHVGGAYRVLRDFGVGAVIIPNYDREEETGSMRRFRQGKADAGIEAHILTQTVRLNLDDAQFVINPSGLPFFLFPPGEDDQGEDAEDNDAPDENTFSIVVSVSHGDVSFLFTADATSQRIREFLRNPDFARTFDFLKLPRHGRYMNRSAQLINTVRPRYAVSTCCRISPIDERNLILLDAIGAEVFLSRRGGLLARSNGTELVVYSN